MKTNPKFIAKKHGALVFQSDSEKLKSVVVSEYNIHIFQF